jgi:hypothetical protein
MISDVDVLRGAHLMMHRYGATPNSSREVCRSDARVWRPGRAARLGKNLADDRRDAPDPYGPTALMQTGRSRRIDRWPRGTS